MHLPDISDDVVGCDDSDHEPETGMYVDVPDVQRDSETELRMPVYVDTHVAIDSMNKCLTEVGVTPYSKTKACQPRYPEKKFDEITRGN